MRISDWSSDVCSSDLPPSLRPGLTRSTLHSATECAQQAGLDGSKSRAGRHLRKSDASLFRARSGSFEPAVAFAGRQGPQQDQQEGRSAPYVWMFPDFLESVASSACRSEERRVGQEWVSMCRSRWSPDH